MGNPHQSHTDSSSSVSCPSDEQCNVSHSHAETMERSYQDEMSKCKPICALPPICFSSSTEHALHNTQSLFLDFCNVTQDCQNLVYLQDDGWIVGPNGKLLLWIPFFYHSSLHYNPWTRFVISRGTSTELDLSRMAHGSSWWKCYSHIS